MKVKNLAHICLHANDLARTTDFYTGILGLKKHFDFFNREGTRIGVYLAVNKNTFIEIFVNKDNLPGPSRIAHFCLEVDNIDSAIQTLRRNNIEVSDKKAGCDHSYQAWFKDPDGNSIEFHEYTPQSSQRTGTDCTIG